MTFRRALGTLLAGGALLAGCAAPAPAPAPAAPDAAAVTLPWPASSAAESTGLQQRVDGGAQPWLLDPTEVALSYVTTAHGWTDATVAPSPVAADGTTLEVTGPHGERRTLVLRQPAVTGPGGIWVVTGDTTL